ncbi:MAG: RNA chaperone Hfq [Clostridia bacterium]|nr:RNA chaperone Hfq [Clostridia bacterium]
MTKQFNLQDAFLNGARKSKTPVTIHVTNGYQIKNALITGYDNFVVTVEADGTQMMIYKSAISTVTPSARISIHHNSEEQEK